MVQALAPSRNLLAVREVTGLKVGRDIHVYDLATAKRVKALAGNYSDRPPRFSADGRFLAAAAGPDVEVWDTATWAKAAAVSPNPNAHNRALCDDASCVTRSPA